MCMELCSQLSVDSPALPGHRPKAIKRQPGKQRNENRKTIVKHGNKKSGSAPRSHARVPGNKKGKS